MLLGSHEQHAVLIGLAEDRVFDFVVHLALRIGSREAEGHTSARRAIGTEHAHRDRSRRRHADLDSLLADLVEIDFYRAEPLLLVREDEPRAAQTDPRAPGRVRLLLLATTQMHRKRRDVAQRHLARLFFCRSLVERLSDNEPEDWPLPEVRK